MKLRFLLPLLAAATLADLGATVALPFLDAMVGAQTPLRQSAAAMAKWRCTSNKPRVSRPGSGGSPWAAFAMFSHSPGFGIRLYNGWLRCKIASAIGSATRYRAPAAN